MARIAEQEIERLKKEISVERLAIAKGVKLKAHGKGLMGLCPFHEDRSPSLVITPEKNLWHCLGACQTGGSVIDWVMKAEGVSFRYAVELLRTDSPSLAAPLPSKYQGKRKGAVSIRSTTPKLESIADRSADDEVLMKRVVGYYHSTLKESPDALTYLERRGLRSAELIERFQLGFADRSLAYRLPPKQRKDGEELRGRLQALGILRETGHEHMRGSLVVPVIDEAGRVTEMYGRKIAERVPEGTPVHLYLPGPHRGVWNVEALASSKEIILCESLIDAMTFWCAGFRHVTASYGVEGFTADHLAAFKKYGTERVLLAYDRDEAGDRGAEKLAEVLMAEGIECWRVVFPRGMDANEYGRKMTPASKALGLVLRSAQWMGKGAPKAAPALDPSETEMPMAPRTSAAPAPATVSDAESVDVSAAEVIVTGENVTALADADGVVIEEIVHGEAEGVTDAEEEAPSLAADPPAVARVPDAPPAEETAMAEGTTTPAMVRPSPVRSPKSESTEENATASGATTVPTTPAVAPPSPARPSKLTTMTTSADEVVVLVGDRRWRVRGLGKNTSPEQMRVNVLVMREGAGFHVDALDLYSARQRASYTAAAATEVGLEERVLKKDLGELLLKLEELRDKSVRKEPESTTPKLSDEEQAVALELLRDPRLLDRILDDFERCGVVGEKTNKLVGYLAATSRKLDTPLAVVIQSSSAAGKSSLMDAVLNLMPEEERVQYSAMTGQSLFYMGEADIQHKILAIVEEQGAESASYALKLLQSEGELTIASTGKDAATGRLLTQEYRVQGPVMIMLTTTAIEVDEELLNRCIVLTVDEGRAQTRAIHARQRAAQTLEGVLARHEKDHVVKVHRDAQRMLRPLLVVNPFAHELTFLDHATRTRRDHTKYLTLIRAIALLHQYQRPVKTAEHRGQALRYVEVTAADIALANRLCHEVLGRSLDELPPQTRRLLGIIDAMVRERCRELGVDREDFRFSRREVRDRAQWGNTQIKVHLGRLVEMEYVVAHRGRQGQGYVYELAYGGEGQDGSPFLAGLLDVDALDAGAGVAPPASRTTPISRGSEGDFTGDGRPAVGGVSGMGRSGGSSASARENGFVSHRDGDDDENARRGPLSNGASYVEVVAARGA
jgi:DNA primase catalytic core